MYIYKYFLYIYIYIHIYIYIYEEKKSVGNIYIYRYRYICMSQKVNNPSVRTKTRIFLDLEQNIVARISGHSNLIAEVCQPGFVSQDLVDEFWWPGSGGQNVVARMW